MVHDWAITKIDDSTTRYAGGTAPSLLGAWAHAVTAAINQLIERELNGCTITVDSAPALLIAGRTDDGQLDLPATRAAAERLALAAAGGLDHWLESD